MDEPTESNEQSKETVLTDEEIELIYSLSDESPELQQLREQYGEEVITEAIASETQRRILEFTEGLWRLRGPVRDEYWNINYG